MMRRRLLARLAAWLQERAVPYFDIYNASDGTLYMGRDWVMPRWLLDRDEAEDVLRPKRWLPFSLRLHRIARPDLDRAFHDHPASFVSLVLSGGYAEVRPTSAVPNWRAGGDEDGYTITRLPGSLAFRAYKDRHRIVSVLPDTVTLVLWFRKRQSWGFFTPQGKVHWKDYESAHNDQPMALSLNQVRGQFDKEFAEMVVEMHRESCRAPSTRGG